MRPNRFIVLVGVDGSGKTSLARLLTRYLESRGRKVKYVWIKSLHLLAYYISRAFEALGRFETIMNPNGVEVKRFSAREGFFCAAWPFIEFISVIPWVVLKVHLPICVGYTVVADRYLVDTIVTVSTRTGNQELLDSIFGRLLLRLIPRNSIIIFVNADLKTILRRREDVEYTYKELESQIALYELLAARVGAIRLDTTKASALESLARIVNETQL